MKKSFAERLGYVAGMTVLFLLIFAVIEGSAFLLALLTHAALSQIPMGWAFLLFAALCSLAVVVAMILEGRANR